MKVAFVLGAVTVIAVAGCHHKPPVNDDTPAEPAAPESYKGEFIMGPDGQHNWTMVKCTDDKTACYKQAALACPTGYEITDNTDQTTTSSTSHGHAGAFGNRGWAAGFGTSKTHTVESHDMQMMIHCKAAAPLDAGAEAPSDE